MDKYEEMKTFVQIVESGGISHAANQLDIAKSAVSRRLNDLEARLDIRLFNRSTRKFNLTDTMKTLLNEVLERIPTDEFMIEQCHVCQNYFNANKEDGIFGDSENLSHFICKQCAQSLSAWDFYQNHLKM